MSNWDLTNLFCGSFEKEFDGIEGLLTTLRPTHAKLLLIANIASLAKVAGTHASDKTAFVEFIRAHSQWVERDCVSLPTLLNDCNRLRRTGKAAQMRADVVVSLNRKMKNWWITASLPPYTHGAIRLLNADPPCDGLVAEVERTAGLQLSREERQIIRAYRHCVLLYDFRNSLVHELRDPLGSTFPFSEEDFACYIGSSIVKWTPYLRYLRGQRFGFSDWHPKRHQSWAGGEPYYSVVYTAPFLLKIGRESLQSLRFSLHRQNINPFDRFPPGKVGHFLNK